MYTYVYAVIRMKKLQEKEKDEKLTKFTTVRIDRFALETVRRFAKIHGWTFNGLLTNLAKAMREAIDGIETDDIRQLRDNYAYSEVAVIPDIKELKGFLIVKTEEG